MSTATMRIIVGWVERSEPHRLFPRWGSLRSSHPTRIQRLVVLGGLLALAALSPKAIAIQPVVVKGYRQEIGTEYSGLTGKSVDVQSVAVVAGKQVYAGTATGLYRLEGHAWLPLPEFTGKQISLLAGSEDETLLVVCDDKLQKLSGRAIGSNAGWVDRSEPHQSQPQLVAGKKRWGLLRSIHPAKLQTLATLPDKGPYYSLHCRAGRVVLTGPQGLYTLQAGHFAADEALRRATGADHRVYQWAASTDGTEVAAAEAGLFRRTAGGTWGMLFPKQAARRWAPEHVAAAGFDRAGHLWFAAPQGVGWLGSDGWRLYTGRDGLPYNGFTSMSFGPDSRVWFGTDRGAIAFDGRHWAYREGRRWLPGNSVRQIAVTDEGTVFAATPRGVGVIERRPMRLAEKARFYEDEIDKRHRRTPWEYVLSVSLKRPGDTSQWTQHDSDNDGQWTGMYGAAECFAYAATQDPKAKKRATKAFEALRFLIQVTQGGTHPAPKGFPARAILPTSGPDPNTWPCYSLEADREEQSRHPLWKVLHPRWPTSADGRWYWKCDTSSDEVDGHYFLYARYYDLVAETAAEKERVRQVVRDLTDHLLEHNFRLVDWDGRPTRWANFSPDSLNQDPNWWEERGLNSLSLLSHLRTAAHITGEAKYDAVANELVQKQGYAMNAMYPKNQRGPGSFTQFDDEMAFMNYYNLLLYEKDPKLRAMFAASCLRYWELEACELNSFFDFVYVACCPSVEVETPRGPLEVCPKQQCLEEAVETLRRYPLNLIDWPQTNSRRLDLVALPAYAREPVAAAGKGCRVNGKVLPIDERVIEQWSDDPWQLDCGGDGHRLLTGAPFLLAYYLGLYHRFIKEN